MIRVIFFLFLLAIATPASALRICSQNLYNYGQRSPLSVSKKGKVKFDLDEKLKRETKQGRYLVRRILKAECDVIAVQEVVGANKSAALQTLERLAEELKEQTRDGYRAFVADTRDERIRNGFLIKEGAGRVREVKSFANARLPKLSRRGPGGYYSRGPFLLDLEFKGKRLLLVSLHFKSKANGWKDPTKTQFESLRIEMAEGVRSIVRKELAERKGKPVVLILGDLNSDRDSPTAEVLSGELILDDFRQNCRISRRLRADCKKEAQGAGNFVRLFDHWIEKEPAKAPRYSYRYRGQGYLIDEILISYEHLRLVERSRGSLALGMEGKLKRGSDHMLLWVELDWE